MDLLELLKQKKTENDSPLGSVRANSQASKTSKKLYALAFIKKENYRDYNIARVFNDSDEPIDDIEYDYLVKFTNLRFCSLIGKPFGNLWKQQIRPELLCTTWKTLTGAKNAMTRIKPLSRFSLRPYNRDFKRDDYVMVIVSIADTYNQLLLEEIEKEAKRQQLQINRSNKKMQSLKKKMII